MNTVQLNCKYNVLLIQEVIPLGQFVNTYKPASEYQQGSGGKKYAKKITGNIFSISIICRF